MLTFLSIVISLLSIIFLVYIRTCIRENKKIHEHPFIKYLIDDEEELKYIVFIILLMCVPVINIIVIFGLIFIFLVFCLAKTAHTICEK